MSQTVRQAGHWSVDLRTYPNSRREVARYSFTVLIWNTFCICTRWIFPFSGCMESVHLNILPALELNFLPTLPNLLMHEAGCLARVDIPKPCIGTFHPLTVMNMLVCIGACKEIDLVLKLLPTTKIYLGTVGYMSNTYKPPSSSYAQMMPA